MSKHHEIKVPLVAIPSIIAGEVKRIDRDMKDRHKYKVGDTIQFIASRIKGVEEEYTGTIPLYVVTKTNPDSSWVSIEKTEEIMVA